MSKLIFQLRSRLVEEVNKLENSLQSDQSTLDTDGVNSAGTKGITKTSIALKKEKLIGMKTQLSAFDFVNEKNNPDAMYSHNDIKRAVEEGKRVCWKQTNYVVTKEKNDRFYIVCTNNDYTVGLMHLDDITSDYDPTDFYCF